MFGMFKRGTGKSTSVLTPTQAIANMMLTLTYDQMVTMATQVQAIADTDDTQTLSMVLNKWAKQQCPPMITAEQITASTITAEKVKPAPPSPPAPPAPTLHATPPGTVVDAAAAAGG